MANLYSVSTAPKFYRHSGFTDAILNSFTVAANTPISLDFQNENATTPGKMYVAYNTGDIVKEHSGFSKTITQSRDLGAGNDLSGISYDGTTYFYSSNDVANKVAKRTGFTNTIVSSFTLGLTIYYGTWNRANSRFYQIERDTNRKFTQHNGFVKTISASFTMAATPDGLSWAGAYMYTGRRAVTDKFFKHSGFVKTITDSFVSTKNVEPFGHDFVPDVAAAIVRSPSGGAAYGSPMFY